MTIKQLVDSEEAYPGGDLAVDGVALKQVTIVGQVRAVNPQSTNITYRLDDGTALIDVKKWIDADKPQEAEPAFQLDQHLRVWGRIKSFNGKRHVGAHFIRAVDDFNEVNYHLLEATYVHLCLTRGQPGDAGQNVNAGNAGGDGDGMFVDSYGGAAGAGAGAGDSRLTGCSPNARKVFNLLLPRGLEGLHLNMIASGTSMSVRDVLSASDELLNQGLIFTTVDDETWAVLDQY